MAAKRGVHDSRIILSCISLFVFFNLEFFCKAAINVAPYGLYWQPALVRYYHRYYVYVPGRIKIYQTRK